MTAPGTGPLVITLRELGQQSGRIMRIIENTGRPAFVTRHGRFIAMITPVDPDQAEARVLAAMEAMASGGGS